MRVLGLFSGIGGMELGLQRAGFTIAAMCEIDPYCRAVLAQHWPGVPIYDDVCTLTAERLRADGISVDFVSGGFPCQDISVAGKRAGLSGARSGLWREYSRLLGELRPRSALVENTTGLLSLGMAEVLGDLAALGFNAEWHCIPASATGAPHRRDRVWIVAHSSRDVRAELSQSGAVGERAWPSREPSGTDVAHSTSAGSSNWNGEPGWRSCETRRMEPAGLGCEVADAAGNGRIARREGNAEKEPRGRQPDRSCFGADVPDANGARLAQRQSLACNNGPQLTSVERSDWWALEPDVGRVADGVPGRVDRLRALGNAVVPQIPEIIGRAILKAQAELA